LRITSDQLDFGKAVVHLVKLGNLSTSQLTTWCARLKFFQQVWKLPEGTIRSCKINH